jgi:hypothetical protein
MSKIEKSGGSFWTTLPGVLTGCAAIITAIATLLGALVATGLIKPSLTSPTPTTAFASSSSPVSSILFQDNFAGDAAKEWIPLFGTWKVVSEQYKCMSSKQSEAFVIAGNTTWKDYAMTARFQLQPSNVNSRTINLGVTGRVQDSGRYYYANLTADRAIIWRRSDVWTSLNEVSHRIADNVWHEIKVEFTGSRINLYVDNALRVSANDSADPSGGVGLRCSQETEAYFDNVIVRPVQ